MALKLDRVVVLRNVESAREQFHACTVRDLARLMSVNPGALRLTVAALLADELLAHTAWSGSLHVTERGRAMIAAQTDVPAPTSEGEDITEAETGTEAAGGSGDSAEAESTAPAEAAPRKRAPRKSR